MGKRKTLSRGEQRTAILGSKEYKSGYGFNKNDASVICGVGVKSIVPLLTAMCNDLVLADPGSHHEMPHKFSTALIDLI